MGGMENVKFTEVLAPVEGQVAWDYFLYVLLFFQLILLVLLFSGSLRDVIFIAVTVMCAVADKTYLFGFIDPGSTATTLPAAVRFHTLESFYTYGARIIMFALPLLITTQTKISKAKPVCIIVALMSFIYVIARWVVQQRVAGQADFDRSGLGIIFSMGMSLYMIRFHWQRWTVILSRWE